MADDSDNRSCASTHSDASTVDTPIKKTPVSGPITDAKSEAGLASWFMAGEAAADGDNAVGDDCALRVIHCWSTPRALSTATMYAFAQRADMRVYDEPLYPAYLSSHPEVQRPYRDSLLAGLDANRVEQEAASALINIDIAHASGGEHEDQVAYVKHIAKFYEPRPDLELLCGPGKRHVLMLRSPLEVVRSWCARADLHAGSSEWEDVGFSLLAQIYRDVKRHTGEEPVVVDTDVLREHPREVLTELCLRLGLPFSEDMLHWEAGPKSYDGPWASHWCVSMRFPPRFPSIRSISHLCVATNH